jgi:hypothetical protein
MPIINEKETWINKGSHLQLTGFKWPLISDNFRGLGHFPAIQKKYDCFKIEKEVYLITKLNLLT